MVGARGVGGAGVGVSGTWSVLIYTDVRSGFQMGCVPRGLKPRLLWLLSRRPKGRLHPLLRGIGLWSPKVSQKTRDPSASPRTRYGAPWVEVAPAYSRFLTRLSARFGMTRFFSGASG